MAEPTAPGAGVNKTGLRIGDTLGGYVLETELGRGGMGVVYRARDEALGRAVALKVVASSLAASRVFRERFRREAQLMATIEHPNVVPVYRAGQDGGRLYIAMRLIDGTDLRSVLDERGRLEPAMAVRLVSQVAFALDAAHDRGLVHRDVKPANVLLAGGARAEHAYLTDFGIARELTGEAVTATGQAVGTLDYMAPEVFRGEVKDHRVDVYALGCLLYEALTGEVPFVRDNDAARMAAHLHDPVPSPRKMNLAVSRDLDEVVKHAMGKRPSDRPRRAGAFGASAIGALGNAQAAVSISAAQASMGADDDVSPGTRTNLRAPSRALIGRVRDLEALVALCRDDGQVIVTLTGPGGVGKTHLALTAAHQLLGDFPEGIFVVELEAVRHATGVAPAIARALELADAPGVPPLRRLAEHLRERRVLLVLDNFEHLLDAAEELAELMTNVSEGRLLVTSQAPLHVAAERVYALRPLELPDGREADLRALAEVPAVALLLQQAQRLDRDIDLTPVNAPSIAELCAQLDGLPLGLELAAARLALLTPEQLLERLSAGLDALGRGGRDVPYRQSGLSAALDWTTRLLTPSQSTLLTRLAVFIGGFTLTLAEAVGDGDVIDDLAVLRDLSLVRRDPAGRLSMPPPVRSFALELPRDPEALAPAHARQADAVLQLVEPTSDRWMRDFADGMRRVAEEADNLREALRWTRSADPDLHSRLAAASAWWFRFSGRVAEGVPELDAALSVAEEPALRARLRMWRDYWGGGTFSQDEKDSDRDRSRASVDACRELGDDRDLVVALFGLSNAHGLHGEGELALASAREAEAVAQSLGDPTYTELAALALGQALERTGNPEGALRVLGPLVAGAHPGSWVAFAGSSYLADAALANGDARSALAGYCRWLREMRAVGSAPNDAFQLDGAAMALAALERHGEALMAAGLSDRLRQEHSFAVPADFQSSRDAALAKAKETLGPAGQERSRAWAMASGIDAGIASIAALA